jgi:hypothetical protein
MCNNRNGLPDSSASTNKDEQKQYEMETDETDIGNQIIKSALFERAHPEESGVGLPSTVTFVGQKA